MKAVIYTRVSSDGQEDGTSLASQYAMCLRKAQELNMSVVAHLEEVQSGASYLGRSKLQSALEMIESGKAQALIFYALDRFSRDREHQEAIKKRIERAGGQMIFATQEFAKSPQGNLMFGITGNFAVYEREVIRERCMNGHRQLLETGITPVRAYPAFGYEIIKSRDPKGRVAGTFEIIEKEAIIIRKIFEMYQSGSTLNVIVKYLHNNKIPTARGGVWRSATIMNMLKNTIYKGKFAYGKNHIVVDESRIERGMKSKQQVPTHESQWIYIDVPAIVSEELFDSVQECRKSRTRRGGRNDRKFLLTSLLICAGCGKRIVGSKGYPATKTRYGKKRNYTCERGDMTGEKCTYKPRYFIADELESRVIETIVYVASNLDLIHQAYQSYIKKNEKPDDKRESAVLKKELADIKKREKIMIEMQITAKLAGSNTSTYDEMIATTSKRRAAIEEQIAKLDTSFPAVEAIIKPFEKFNAESIDAIQKVLSDPDIPNHEKNTLLSGVIHHIIPIAKNHVKVLFKSGEKGFYIIGEWQPTGITTGLEKF